MIVRLNRGKAVLRLPSAPTTLPPFVSPSARFSKTARMYADCWATLLDLEGEVELGNLATIIECHARKYPHVEEKIRRVVGW